MMSVSILLLTRASVDGVRLAIADAGYDTAPGYINNSYLIGDSPCVFAALIASEDKNERGADKIEAALNSRGVAWLYLSCGMGGAHERLGIKLGEPKHPYRTAASPSGGVR